MTRVRHGARIVILDPDNRFLLFRFHYVDGPLAGKNYWAMPGGGVEPGESPAEAAVRELLEETGLRVETVGSEAGRSEYDFRLSSGEDVWETDHYFVLRLAERPGLSKAGFTEEETASMVEHRWWSLAELRTTRENVVPGDLLDVLTAVGIE